MKLLMPVLTLPVVVSKKFIMSFMFKLIFMGSLYCKRFVRGQRSNFVDLRGREISLVGQDRGWAAKGCTKNDCK